ncbi:unnamed protein product [Aureobasidium vineae]|uniref:Uncharacterized protein n=1 Tax=Aureobasidium vineae TaxID=2773715 RepID=A0A9N8K0L1_9PEZI|nr:unnamed protein product [Aureobasidium vineae]
MDHKLPYIFQEDAHWAAEPEEIDIYAKLVVACAENHLSPLAAAQEITDILAREAWKNKAEIDLHDEDRPYNTNTALVAVSIGSCVSSFPPHSVVHERLFNMIRSFIKVEKRSIPNIMLDRTGKFRYGDHDALEESRPTVLLWENLSPLSFSSSCEWLADVGETWTGVEKCGSRNQQRWRNLSYFSARLAIEGIEHMGWRSPLQRLLPKYGMPNQKTVGYSGFLAGQVLAAAQWFIPKDHAFWVWRACCNCEKLCKSSPWLASGPGSSADSKRNIQEEKQADEKFTANKTLKELAQSEGWLWNLENWKSWKAAFTDIVGRVDDVRVHGIVRRDASKAVKVMEELEIYDEAHSCLLEPD